MGGGGKLTTVCENVQGIIQIGGEIRAKLTLLLSSQGIAREIKVLSTDSAIPTLKCIRIF